MSVRAPKKSAGKPHDLSLKSVSSGDPGKLDESTYRDMFEEFPQALWVADPRGNIIYGNRLWREFTGIGPHQTAENGWVPLVHPEDRPKALANWRKLIATGVSSQDEYRFRRASDGEYRWHLIQSLQLKDANGAVARHVGIAVDIHAQKANEIALREKDDQLKLTMEAGRLGTWDFFLAGHTFRSSYRSRALFGRPPDVELTFDEFVSMLHPDDRNLLQQTYIRAMEPSGLSEFEINYRIIRPDGAVRWITARGKGIFSGAGSERKPVRLTGTVQDITEKKLAEEALCASEAKFRALIENSSDAIILLDEGLSIVYSSAGTLRILGYSADDIVGRPAMDFCHPDRIDALKQLFHECLQNPGKTVAGTARIRHKDGSWRDLEGVLTNLLHDPHVGGIVGNYRDITEKVQAERALRESEEKFRTAFHSNPEAMSITTLADGVYLDVNNAFLRVTGFTREDVVGRRSVQLGSWVDTEHRARMVQALKSHGRLESMETSFHKKNGEIFQVHLSAEMIEIGNIKCVLATSQDVSERTRVTEELRRSEEQYRSLIERSPFGICRISAQGRFLLVNPALAQMLGYESVSELLALDVATQVYEKPEARDALISRLAQDPSKQPPIEARWKRRDGQVIIVRLVGTAIRDDQGRLLHSEVFVEPISAQ
jgi:PAS domain S-box-containing protein